MAYACTALVSQADWAALAASKSSRGGNLSAFPQLGKGLKSIHRSRCCCSGGVGAVWPAAVSVSLSRANQD